MDLDTSTELYHTRVNNEDLIGRLITGLYTLADGHMYYHNNVIKIRYDLIDKVNNLKYNEDDIFNFYEEIFETEENMKVQSNTPINSLRVHKFAYLFSDTNQKSMRSLVVLPYLHERKIYLNRIKINTQYFYTSVETKFEEVYRYHQELEKEYFDNRVDPSRRQQLEKAFNESIKRDEDE